MRNVKDNFMQKISILVNYLLLILLLVSAGPLRANSTDPIIFFTSSAVPNEEDTEPAALIDIANQMPGRNMATYEACVASAAALPQGQGGGCSVGQLSSPEPSSSATYNGYSSTYVAKGTIYSFAKYADGTTSSNTQENANNATISLNMRCLVGSVVCKGQSGNYSCSCSINEPAPNQCTASGDPINYLSGDLFETDIDFESGGISVKRNYLNQRQGWVVASVDFLTDLSGRFSLDNGGSDSCLGYKSSYALKKLTAPYDNVNNYTHVTVDFCLAYKTSSTFPSGVTLRQADGLHKYYYKKNGYYQADFSSGIIYEIDPTLNNDIAWKLVFPNGDVQYFDKLGFLREQHKKSAHIFYDYQNGKLTGERTSAGASVSFEYNQDNKISVLKVSNDYSITYEYEHQDDGDFSRLKKVIFPDGTFKLYLYENSLLPNALTGAIDRRGVRYSTWGYDSQGRAVFSENANGVNHYSFDYSVASKVSVINPLLKKTTYTFSTINGRRVVSRVDGVQSANCGAANQIYTYYSNGLLKSKTDWNGVKTSYIYNSDGQEISRTEADGTALSKKVTTEWGLLTNLRAKVTEPGKVTNYTYDSEGNLISTIVTSSEN